ncbi:HD domain-containing phosphohydrolase [Rahnella laticis]|uniref:HD domain-containing phosphohydrolase n=1 Tax=Rahnella laticis TaxID=2787622 RepID=UPI0018A2741E|nr:HD domain-containing phosphohydrolase [Rahnella laticis]MBF7994905.1 metal-dependent phosphohydrolase [Rahnella laticis]
MKTRIKKLKNRYPLHIQITVLFTFLIVSIGCIIILFSHTQLTKLTEVSTHQQYQKTGEAIAAELDSVTRNMAMSVDILTKMPITAAQTEVQRMALVSNFIMVLQQNHYASSVYSAYQNGDFFILRRLTDQNRALFNAPASAQWLAQNYRFDLATPEKKEFYLDNKQNVISSATVPYDNYDPRSRKWFTLASAEKGLITSPNYIFKGTGETGFTYSQQADNQHAVIGLDVSLASLSAFLQQQGLPPGSQAAILSESGEVIASQPAQIRGNTGAGNLPVLQPLFTQDNAGNSRLFSVDNQDWYGAVINIHSMGNDYRLAIATPSAFLTADASAISNRSTLIAFLLLLLSLPVIWYFSRRISRPLISLRKDAEAISNLHFEVEDHAGHSSVIEEVDDLHTAMAKMKLTLTKFISMGSMLTVKNNFTQQMQGLLTETTEIADMTGGMVFLANQDMNLFTPAAFRWREENIELAGISPLEIDNDRCSEFWQIVKGQTISGSLTQESLPAPLLTFFRPHLPLRYVAVPMQTHDNQLLGFLLLFNTRTLTDKHENAKIQLINSLVGMLSVAIEAQHLLVEQKNLMNAFIKLIAGAIDEKSAYTGGHCQRVPVITKMLAKAAVESREGPFASFTLSENEWEELHTACWLHDCGKITTPEAVVDKATKLELIYNRIHEIRMRFELLKREKEVAFLREHAGQPTDSAQAHALNETLRQLDDDFYFIARCNIGSEFLSDDALVRISQIAGYRWTRTLDDTAGISREELVRKQRLPQPALPVQEPMLADKEEHIVYRDGTSKQADRYHFKLKKPELQYNYGEIYNLAIRRGTLNDEERYKINEHIMQTIIMLENLPFPRTMSNVPVIAGGHHERVDGKGYPYQLNYTQMSVQVRMMAIADVFEALTAADRPYKPGKLLSEALNIMVSMVNEHHLDRDLFILFLQSGIWRDYAQTYLEPEKADSVDIAALLAKIAPQPVEDIFCEVSPA